MSRKKGNNNVKLTEGVPGSFSLDFKELMETIISGGKDDDCGL